MNIYIYIFLDTMAKGSSQWSLSWRPPPAGTQTKAGWHNSWMHKWEKREVEIYRKGSKETQLFRCATVIFSPKAVFTSWAARQFPAAVL